MQNIKQNKFTNKYFWLLLETFKWRKIDVEKKCEQVFFFLFLYKMYLCCNNECYNIRCRRYFDLICCLVLVLFFAFIFIYLFCFFLRFFLLIMIENCSANLLFIFLSFVCILFLSLFIIFVYCFYYCCHYMIITYWECCFFLILLLLLFLFLSAFFSYY